MVVTQLLGGLGNQMFQYAVGRHLADRLRVPLKLDLTEFEHYSLRRFSLDHFNIRAEILTEKESERLQGIAPDKSPLSKILDKFGCIRSYTFLKEASFRYDERIEKVYPPIYLNGYWQSELYFPDAASVLRKDFSLREKIDSVNSEFAKLIDGSTGAVSLHVRRGDYVKNPQTFLYHGVCSLEYYHRAVDYIAKFISNPHFFIFSDDLDWVMENIVLDYPMTLVNANGPDSGFLDLDLMRRCRHHIIANSSFSWWGAWLGNSPCKTVVAPSVWFNDVSIDTRDLIPAGWIKL